MGRSNSGNMRSEFQNDGADTGLRHAELGQFLPNWTEFQAIGHRYVPPDSDGTSGQSERPRSPPDEWMETVDSPFETVRDVSSRLKDVESTFRATGDRRSVFLTVYTAMTEAVNDGLDAGFFEDPEWVARLLVTFANHYRRALIGYERNSRRQVPLPWEVGFDATLGGTTVVLQDALLGINAHINYDLAYALERVRIDPNRKRKLNDYNRINDILARLVDDVQAALSSVYDSQLVEDLDQLFGRLDESLADLGLAGGREFAWSNAEFLADTHWPFSKEYVNWRLTSVSTGVAYMIRSPPLEGMAQSRLQASERRLSALDDFRIAFQDGVPSDDPSTWDNLQ
jgi:hypothetical protein